MSFLRANNGLLTWEQIAQAALQYMSEDDVQGMAESYELIEDDGYEKDDDYEKDEDDDEEEDDEEEEDCL